MDDSATRRLRDSTRSADLPERLVQELVRQGERRVYEVGAFVHERGDPGDRLFRVLSGRIRMSTVSRDGRETVLADLEPGSFFGEVSLLDGLPRTHDARAVARSEILSVKKERFEALLREHPDLSRWFLQSLALKLRMSLTALEGVALSTVSARLALRLFLMATRDPAGTVPTVRVSQGDLAMMVGTTRQSINKDLQAWQRAGIVRIERRGLTILNEEALLALANT